MIQKKISTLLKTQFLSTVNSDLFQTSPEKITRFCFQTLIISNVKPTSVQKLMNKIQVTDENSFNNMINQFILFISELLSQEFDVIEVEKLLQDQEIDEGTIKVIAEGYQKLREYIKDEEQISIRNKLFNTQIGFKQLIGVEYTNSLVFSTEKISRVKENVFDLKLVILNQSNQIEKIFFRCGIEEINNLIWELKVACKSIEKSIGSLQKQ